MTDITKPLVLKGKKLDLQSYIENKKLPILTLELGSKCNLDCIYCLVDQTPDKGSLEPYEIVDLLDQAYDLGTRVVQIGGDGEPFMNKGIWETINHAYEKGMTTIIDTNGTCIGKKEAKMLYENNVSPDVKITSFDPEVYNYLAGVPLNSNFPKKAYKGVISLLEAGFGNENIIEEDNKVVTRLSIMSLLCKPAYSTLPGVFKFCREHNAEPNVCNVVAKGQVVKRRNLDELKLSKEEEKNLYEKYTKIMGYSYPTGLNRCDVFYGLFFDKFGNVTADKEGRCCDTFNETIFASIREKPLKQIWNELLDLREKNKEKLECQNQEFKDSDLFVFPSCPAMYKTQIKYYEEFSN